MRRWLFSFSLFVLFFVVSVVSAREILQTDHCVVAAGETVEGNLFVTCRTLEVDGTVTGNLIGTAATATIGGTIKGSVYLLGGQLDVFGTIERDLHFAGPVLHVHSGADIHHGSLISASLSTIAEDTVAGSVIGAGYQLDLRSAVGGEVNFWGSALNISGHVRGDVDASVGDPQSTGFAELRTLLTPTGIELTAPGLYVTGDGMIDGQLTYTGPVEGQVLVELPNAPVFHPIVTQPDITALAQTDNPIRSIQAYAIQVFREVITLGLIGALALLLAPHLIQAPIPTLRMRPLPSLGVGLLAFILSFPIFLVIILLSIIFVVLLSLLQLPELTFISGVTAAVLDFSSMGLFFFTAFIISRIIVALALGRFLMRRLAGDDTSGRARLLSLLLGVVLLSVFASLPVVGWLISALAVFFGLGAILTLLQEELERMRSRSQTKAVPVTSSIEAKAVPPPSIDDEPADIGTQNLPEGFQWWD